MFYMIINGFNTSTIPHCVVTDFGQVEAAKPRVVEDGCASQQCLRRIL